MQLFREYLKNRYKTLQNYNQIHATTHESFESIFPPTLFKGNRNYHSIKEMQNIIDWNDYFGESYGNLINELKQFLQLL